jgi:glyoxylase-like metal-dependent hydrolase (beta-lactamase superfamily II)
MKKLPAVAVAAIALLSAHVFAQRSAQDPRAAIDSALAAMGTVRLETIQYSGTGAMYPTGQGYTAGGPWPKFTVTKYMMSINYATPSMRQELVRIDDQLPARGGGAGGFNPATGQGGIRPVPGDIGQNQTTDGRTEVGALNFWLTPHGFVKGAAAHAATAKMSQARGNTLLSFTAFGKYTVTGTLDERHLVERVETRMDVPFTGDTLFEGIYSDYRDVVGVKYPMRVVMRQGGFPTLELTLNDVRPNSPAPSGAPDGAQRDGGPPTAPSAAPQASRPEPERIADGIWFMTPGAPGSILVEFNDHVVLVEGPGGDAQTLATLANVKKVAANKPVRYVINTHHHADHAGGIRAYVAEGTPVITHQSNERFYAQQIFRNAHTINPDRLARAPRPATIETMGDKRVFTDGSMTLEVHLLRGNGHSEGLLMAYVPRERLLIQADAFAPRPGAKPLPAPSPFTVNLVDNVARLKLDVAQVVHVHGGISPWGDVLMAAGR